MENSLILSPEKAIKDGFDQRAILQTAVKKLLVKGTDYYSFVTGQKDSLAKAGAEKLLTVFKYSIKFELVRNDMEWDKNLFYFQYKAIVFDPFNNRYIEALGSCNSWEDKYRYRAQQAKCPTCGQESIKQGKENYYCNKKQDGCGANFPLNDERITSQKLGKIENPEIPSLINTIDKMAQKRAMVAATLIATGASAFFTQDLEDMTNFVIEAEFVPQNSELDMLAWELGYTDGVTFMAETNYVWNGKAALIPDVQRFVVQNKIPVTVKTVTLIEGKDGNGLKFETPLGNAYSTDLTHGSEQLVLGEITPVDNMFVTLRLEKNVLWVDNAHWN